MKKKERLLFVSATCELCFRPATDKHHFIPGANRNCTEYKGIKQRLLNLCRMCHTDVHSLNKDKFAKKYGKDRGAYIYQSVKLDGYKAKL